MEENKPDQSNINLTYKFDEKIEKFFEAIKDKKQLHAAYITNFILKNHNIYIQLDGKQIVDIILKILTDGEFLADDIIIFSSIIIKYFNCVDYVLDNSNLYSKLDGQHLMNILHIDIVGIKYSSSFFKKAFNLREKKFIEPNLLYGSINKIINYRLDLAIMKVLSNNKINEKLSGSQLSVIAKINYFKYVKIILENDRLVSKLTSTQLFDILKISYKYLILCIDKQNIMEIFLPEEIINMVTFYPDCEELIKYIKKNISEEALVTYIMSNKNHLGLILGLFHEMISSENCKEIAIYHFNFLKEVIQSNNNDNYYDIIYKFINSNSSYAIVLLLIESLEELFKDKSAACHIANLAMNDRFARMCILKKYHLYKRLGNTVIESIFKSDSTAAEIILKNYTKFNQLYMNLKNVDLVKRVIKDFPKAAYIVLSDSSLNLYEYLNLKDNDLYDIALKSKDNAIIILTKKYFYNKLNIHLLKQLYINNVKISLAYTKLFEALNNKEFDFAKILILFNKNNNFYELVDHRTILHVIVSRACFDNDEAVNYKQLLDLLIWLKVDFNCYGSGAYKSDKPIDWINKNTSNGKEIFNLLKEINRKYITNEKNSYEQPYILQQQNRKWL